jgi:hypothetical protein
MWQSGCHDHPQATPTHAGHEIFVRGTFFDSDEATSWDVCDDRNRMQQIGDNSYALTIPLKPGSYNFKFGDQTWTKINYGAESVGETVGINRPDELISSEMSGNLGLTIVKTGKYKFELDTSNVDHPQLRVTTIGDSHH